jgi:hypothetical protein
MPCKSTIKQLVLQVIPVFDNQYAVGAPYNRARLPSSPSNAFRTITMIFRIVSAGECCKVAARCFWCSSNSLNTKMFCNIRQYGTNVVYVSARRCFRIS